MRLIKIFSLLIAVSFVIVSCNNLAKIQKSKDPEYKLQKANEFFEKKKYKNAQALYEELFTTYKGSQKFEELYYKYAYTFYYLGMYHEAEGLFKGYLEVFPTSSKAEEIDYMRAYSFYKQSPPVELEQVNTKKAMLMMQTFINTHPGSERNKDAAIIIDEARAKLELKDYKTAKLYYNLSQYRAAALAFADLLDSYPESMKGEEYKLMVVKSYYQFARLSIESKKLERYEKVVEEYQDFLDRFPESSLRKEVESYSKLSLNHIKELKNEQATSSAGF